MFSKLRQSFRRKTSSFRRRSSSHRQSSSNGIEEDNHDHVYDLDDDARSSLRSQSVRSSRTSLASGSIRSSSVYDRSSSGRDAETQSQWQRCTNSVVESNRVMFNRQLHCDVMFVVGETRALVGAHRFVLLSRSDVMYRMFCGPLAETGPVVIPDVTEDVFRQFLEFLYVDEVTLTPDNVTPLHYLGRKYDVEPLVQRCLEYLHARLTCDNACSILEQAHCFDEHELLKASFHYVQQNLRQCLEASGFSTFHDLCRDCLERLLSLDDLDVNELQLFKAALSWAESSLKKKQETIDASHVRQELGRLLHLFRFPALTLTQLQQNVFPTQVLTPEEVKVLMEFKDGRRSSVDPFVERGRLMTLCRFEDASRVRCSNQSEASHWTAAITVNCNRDFNLHAIQLFSCTRESQQASVRFSVLQGQDQIDLFNRCTADYPHTYSLTGLVDGVKTMTMTLTPPLILSGHTDHTLVVQADMADCLAGSDGHASVTCDDVTFRFRDARVRMNGTTVSEGQIPSFVYSVRGGG